MSNLKTLLNLREVRPFPALDLPNVLPYKVKSQEIVGIEVEVENVNNTEGLHKCWQVKEDNSLRNNGVEFVTLPMEACYTPNALHHLLNTVLTKDCCFSPRTSVHVHLNAQDLTSEQTVDFLVVYSIFEKLLYQFAGRGRIKNIYCVPIVETNLLKYFVSRGGLGDQWSKYTGLNLCRLRDIGTLEFRHMHGTFDVDKLSTWINLITSLKAFVLQTPTKEIRLMLYHMDDSFDFNGFLQKVFGDYANALEYKSIKDVRLGYMQAKIACSKHITLTKIQSQLSTSSHFLSRKAGKEAVKTNIEF